MWRQADPVGQPGRSEFHGEKLIFHGEKHIFHAEKLIFHAEKLSIPRLA
jgi:hypothetical protein